MSRPFSLQSALDLADRQAESKLRLVKQAYVVWLNARTQIVRLQQRQEKHVHVLSEIMQSGCAADVAQMAAVSARDWQTGYASAQAVERHANQHWQQALVVWQQEKKRVVALQILATHHLQAENLLEEKRERRLHDELSQRSTFAWRATEHADISFVSPSLRVGLESPNA